MDAKTRVVALVQQNDIDEAGVEYVHAYVGDQGTVIATFPGAIGPTIRWDREGTLNDCHESEIEAV